MSGQRSKVKGQGHQGQKRHFSALTAACVRFIIIIIIILFAMSK